MTLITENGWPQVPATALRKGFVPGLDGVQIELLDGDVYTILAGFLIWFDRNVEDVERNFNNGERDEWGWSRTNSVWNSNHLSGTAMDVNATKYPMGYYNMERHKVDKVREGLRLFEGTIFWGRDWNTPDEMHFQIQGNAHQIKGFADKLRGGYLGIWGEPDPKAYPLPAGYYFGPLDGPNESVSGLYHTDSEHAKNSLGRWQEAAGIPVTRHWDEATFQAVAQLQIERGWFHDGNAFKGRIYTGEWDAVIRDGWKFKPQGMPVEQFGVHWADVSQYQGIPVNREYPYRVFTFRVNTGDDVDDLADANYRIACEMADEGRLDLIIAYAFYRPHSAGHSTYATFKKFFDGRGVHPKLAVMVDVENARGSQLGEVKGDQSFEANGFIDLAVIDLLGGDRRRTCGYHNFVADPGMWVSLPPDLKMIRPNYSIQPGKGKPDGPQLFAHQYTQTGRCAPWGDRDIDLNYFAGTLRELLEAFGVATPAPSEPAPVPEAPPNPEPEPIRRRVEVAPGETIEVTGKA